MEAMVKFTNDPFLVKYKAKKLEKNVRRQAVETDIHDDILYTKLLLDTKKKTLFECTMDKTFGIGFTLAQRHKIRKMETQAKTYMEKLA